MIALHRTLSTSDATGMDFYHPRAPGILGLFSPPRPDPRGDPRGSGTRGFPRGSSTNSLPPPMAIGRKMERSVGIQQIEHYINTNAHWLI